MDIIDFLLVDEMMQYQTMIVFIIGQTIGFGVWLFKTNERTQSMIRDTNEKTQLKISELEFRLSSVEKQDDKISDKLDQIQGDIQEIKIELKDKANR